jgi:hypothetical protein
MKYTEMCTSFDFIRVRMMRIRMLGKRIRMLGADPGKSDW